MDFRYYSKTYTCNVCGKTVPPPLHQLHRFEHNGRNVQFKFTGKAWKGREKEPLDNQ